jgi:hypothetical protein
VGIQGIPLKLLDNYMWLSIEERKFKEIVRKF